MHALTKRVLKKVSQTFQNSFSVLGVVVVKKNEFHDFTFPDDVPSLKNSDEKIVLPASRIPSGNGGKMNTLYIICKYKSKYKKVGVLPIRIV